MKERAKQKRQTNGSIVRPQSPTVIEDDGNSQPEDDDDDDNDEG